jgi:hypothetical protein
MSDLLLNIEVTMHRKTLGSMKKIVGFLILSAVLVSACSGPKAYYKTKEGKKKQKYYNDIQFGGKSASQMKKP